MKRRTNQGGSIVTFVVIGVILVIGLGAAIYGLSKHSEQTRKNQSIEANEKQQTDNKTSDSTKSTNSETATTDGDTVVTSTTKSSDSSQGLPNSGSELSVGKLFAVYLLVSTTTAYILSRRKISNSL
jgi:Flp pilus assembly protein TadB